MGQAKQKGTFEQRQQAAYAREDALVVQRAEHLKRLEEAEEASTKRSGEMLAHFVGQSLQAAARQMPLMTADFTLVPGFNSVASSELIKDERKKLIDAELAS